MTSPTYTDSSKLEIYHKYKLRLHDCCIEGTITATFLGYGESKPELEDYWGSDLIFNIGTLYAFNRIDFEDLGVDQNHYPPKSLTRKRKKK